MQTNPVTSSLVFAGEVHYFRLQRSEWDSRLDALQESGLDTVASYIPWLCHEPRPGEFDLTGRTRPELDVGAFIDACAARGLRFFARPGPFVMAELKNEGVPFRLYRDHPELVCPTWHGRPVPNKNLDYSAPAFRNAAREWYRQVAAVLRPRAFTVGGPVVAVQLDNEIGMLNWVANSPDLSNTVLTEFGAWATARYGSDGVRARYGFVPGPDHRERLWNPDDAWALPFTQDLGHFMRTRFSAYVGFLKGALDEEGLGSLVSVVNIHGTGGGRGHPFPIGISQLLKTWQDHPDVAVGTDIYLGDLTVANLADLYLLNAATRSTLSPGQTLGSVEFEAGDGDYGATTGLRYDPSAADLKARLCLRQGQTLFNYYLYAGGRNYHLDEKPGDGNDRIAFTGERHGFAAPVDPEGRRNTTWDRIGRSVRASRALADHLATATEETDDLVWGFVPDLWMTDAIPPDSPSARAFREDLERHRSGASWDLLARWALLSGYRFGAVDLSRHDPKPGTTLFLGSASYLDEDLQTRLAAWVTSGGRLVLWGTLPMLTLEGQVCTVLADAMGARPQSVHESRPGFHLSVVPEGPLARWAEASIGRAVSFAVPPAATVLMRTYHSRDVTAFLAPVGRGVVVVMGSEFQGRPEFARDLLGLVGCSPALTHNNPWNGLVLGTTRDPHGGRVLHVMNLDGCDVRFHVTENGAPLLEGTELLLGPREGRFLPLGVHPTGAPAGVTVLWSTAEFEGSDGRALTLRRGQPVDALVIEAPPAAAPRADDHWAVTPQGNGRWKVTSKQVAWPGTLSRLQLTQGA